MSTHHSQKSDSVPQLVGNVPLRQRIIANVPTVTLRLFHLQYLHHIPPKTLCLIRNIYCPSINKQLVATITIYYRPKHVELIEVTNKLLLLHLVGFLNYCIGDARSHKHQITLIDPS